ncbi:type IV secretion system DNA-binding domain-containing protein [Bradyrhizobium daqingense]|uniref:Type IV secretion system coupling TraD/TrwB family protein n=1 Tax=Bradyrhizobium daqingense TaxID=993502 RepID=A0A562KLQ2_9BRAD|nr:type IV secretion system DNA-binding domain-containing protein [Bradyrhizobium daqingense]TWH96163.1 type IV secretion system coupling TraD/TrwB family protein [Bradyrhizobium daqingense]UFS89572.1 type IV secretion system DNA-binding domain-containing protein [Bradyrhizobium daqingense]
MAASRDKCIQCGNRHRSYDLEPPPESLASGSLDPDGKFMGMPYWFCSVECYKKAVRKFLEPRYDFDRQAEDDDDYKEHVENATVEYYVKARPGFGLLGSLFSKTAWMSERDFVQPEREKALDAFLTRKQSEITGAELELHNRLYAEWMHQIDEENKKNEAEAAKRQDQIIKLAKEEKEREEKRQRELEIEMAQQQAVKEMLSPKEIPQHIRYEHTHVLGPSGSGKTTLLQNNLLKDFVENSNPPAYIVVDPKGLMVERLARLKTFSDRVVIVDPADAPALNLFATDGRDPAQLVSDFSYIFSTTKQKLTGKQAACFQFCARMLFSLPGANLETLLDLLDDRINRKPPNPLFETVIKKLPSIPRRFFESDFYSANYASTREEIKSRIYGIAGNETLAVMFNAATRKLDLGKCIRDRKIVLVNTRLSQLKEAHQTLGRYILSLAQDAIQSRNDKHPVYVMIDEFQEFADSEKTPQLFRLLREYNGGAIVAHQNMYCDELDEATRNAISTNTSIKYASSPEAQDLNYMARDLRCSPDFLKHVHKSESDAYFACFVRGMHPPLEHPFIHDTQLGWIDEWPKISDAEYHALRERNKRMLQDSPLAFDGAAAFAAPKHDWRATLGGADVNEPIVQKQGPPSAVISQGSGQHIASAEVLDPSKPAPWKRK